jgi:hypothetical protein
MTKSSTDLGIVMICGLFVTAAAVRNVEPPAPVAQTPEPPALSMAPLPAGATEKPFVVETIPTGGCDFPETNSSGYLEARTLPIGKVLIPTGFELPPDGGYDLLAHFHGAEPIRKMVTPLGLGLVVATVDIGTLSGGYARVFDAPGTFDSMLSSISHEVSVVTNHPAARPRSIILSSWSAGYGAVRRIIAPGRDDIDAVVLIDSLYASYAQGVETPDPAELSPFAALARSAARGGPLLVITHSSVQTVGYSSTVDTASFLLRDVGLDDAIMAPPETDPFGLIRARDRNHFFVRGYAGRDAAAHCAQLRLLPDILRRQVLPSLNQ